MPLCWNDPADGNRGEPQDARAWGHGRASDAVERPAAVEGVAYVLSLYTLCTGEVPRNVTTRYGTNKKKVES